MKQGPRILAVTFGIVALLVLAKFGLNLLRQPSDEQLIVKAVEDGIKASRNGQPGGVLEKLSASLTVNGEDTPGSRGQIADYVKRLKPDVEFTSLKPQIFGEEARIETPAVMKVGILGMSQKVDLERVTITLKKESGFEYLIFPTKSWRVTDVRVDVNALQMFGGG